MNSLKRRLKKALTDPIWWMCWAILGIILAVMLLIADVNASGGFEITIHNTSDKAANVIIMTPEEGDPEYMIKADSARNIPMSFGEFVVCVGFERISNGDPIIDFYRCAPVKITPENLYDEDGNKMYWEISR